MKRLTSYINKILLNGGLFALIIFLTYHFVFTKINITSSMELLRNFNPLFLIIAVMSIIAILALETLTIKRNLLVMGEERSFLSCIKYTFAGNFFSTITPSATGGQPMQLYLMSRDNIKTDKGALALLMDLFAYQIALLSFGLLGFVLFLKDIVKLFGNYYVMFIIGIALNALLLVITMLTIFSNKLIYQIVTLCNKVLRNFRYKKADSIEKSALQWVEKYKQSAAILKINKRTVAFNILLTFARIALMFTPPLWVYMGLGLSSNNLLLIVAVQAVLHISCAALPLPGGVGIGETAFLIGFNSIFPASIIDTAMLLSRGVGFYSIAFVSGISLSLWYLLKDKKCFCTKTRTSIKKH